MIINGNILKRKKKKRVVNTSVEGLELPEKKPVTRTAKGVRRLRAMYIGIFTPLRLARANATFAL